MPAPASATIQATLKQAFLAKGFTKKTYVNGAVVSDPTTLPDALQTLIEAFANGDAAWFATWQGAQSVLIPATSTSGTPSVGNLP
jgi:hypothetical protein